MAVNPMLGMLNQNQMVPIKQMLNLVRGAQNPQAMLQQMIQRNPQLQTVMNYINQNGGDARTAFYKMAEEKGVDPDSILSQLR